jgi:hypothetical protein
VHPHLLIHVCTLTCPAVAFSIYDLDGDGYISGEDLYMTLSVLMGKTYSDAQLEQVGLEERGQTGSEQRGELGRGERGTGERGKSLKPVCNRPTV